MRLGSKKRPDKSYVDAYRKNGVTVIRAVFQPEEMNALRSAAYMALTQLPRISENGYKHTPLQTVKHGISESPALTFWPSLANETLNQFRADPRLHNIVTSLLGPNVKQLNNQVYYRMPGDGDSFSWHQDIMFRSPRSEYPGLIEQDAYLQTAIIVDRMRSENGGVEYVLGSHKLGDIGLIEDHDHGNLRGFDRNRNAEKFKHLPTRVFDADPGDVVIWSSLIVHGSQPNRSNQHRMYYMNGFAKAECSRLWPYYVKSGHLVDLDPSLIP